MAGGASGRKNLLCILALRRMGRRFLRVLLRMREKRDKKGEQA
jgi:hypothetical protein